MAEECILESYTCMLRWIEDSSHARTAIKLYRSSKPDSSRRRQADRPPLVFTQGYGMRSGLGPDQVRAVARAFTALFLRSDGSLPKFPFSGIGRGRNVK